MTKAKTEKKTAAKSVTLKRTPKKKPAPKRKAAKQVKKEDEYTSSEKATLIKAYQKHRKTMNTVKAAEKTGIPYITLHYWEKKARGKKAKATEKRKVGRKKVGSILAEYVKGGSLFQLVKVEGIFELRRTKAVVFDAKQAKMLFDSLGPDAWKTKKYPK